MDKSLHRPEGEQPRAPVPVAARHTLGSDPDSVNAPVPGAADSRSSSESAPEALMRPVWWLSALQRVRDYTGDPARAKLVVRLLEHVEQAWSNAAELQAACCSHRDPASEHESLQHFLQFVESDVVELFFRMAQRSAQLVTGPDPRSTTDEIERFIRNLEVMRLAAADGEIPGDLRVVIHRLGRDLSDWFSDFAPLIGAVTESDGLTAR